MLRFLNKIQKKEEEKKKKKMQYSVVPCLDWCDRGFVPSIIFLVESEQ